MRSLRSLVSNKEVKNAGWIIAGRVAQMLLSFFVSIFTTRFLGPSNYGLLNYALAYVTFFSSLCTLGIGSVILKHIVDTPEAEGEIIGTSILLRAVASAFSILTIIGISCLVDKDEPLTIVVTSLCSISLMFQVADTFNYWFQLRYKSKTSSIATLIAYVIVSLYRLTLLYFNKDVRWFAFANSVDYICIATVLVIAYRNNNGPRLSFSCMRAKKILSKSYHYILSGMMIAVYSQTDKFMLKQMVSEETVGYYSLASSINTMWVFVLAAIIDSMYPTILQYHKTSKEQFEQKNRQLYAIVIYISLFVALFFLFFGRFFIEMIYGQEYIPAANPLKIVTWYVIFSYLSVARNAWIVCENKQKYLKYMYGSAALLNVLLNYYFIPLFGASGAALASVITQFFATIVFPLFIRDLRPNVRLMIDAFLLWPVFFKDQRIRKGE